MKYLILLTLISTASAAALKERLDQIDDLRLGVYFCNIDAPNLSVFKKMVIKNNDVATVECLESKAAQIAAYKAVQKNNDNIKKEARNTLDNFNCDEFSGQDAASVFMRAVCQERKVLK